MKNALRPSILRFAVASLAVAVLPRGAAAGEFEVYGNFGVTFPF